MDETKQFLQIIEEGYKRKRDNNLLSKVILKRVIEAYYSYIEKPIFSILVDEYKVKYIYNEARVEKNITKEEQLGLGVIYDYINDFDFEKDYFNIFITSLLLHQKLYSKCPNKEFGGKLRNSNVYMFDSIVEVPDFNQANIEFNKYITKSDSIFQPLNNNDIFAYIDNCIKLNVELIKMQPFQDGNKRTFRSLLNLLLKKIEIPPIYIKEEERYQYKEYLIKAMNDNDEELIHFYYQKICDVIVETDLDLSQILSNPKIKIKI